MKTFEYSGFLRIKSKRIRSISLVLWKDIRSREMFFELIASEIFLTWYLDLGPAVRTDFHDPSGTDGFDNLVGLKIDLNATATQWKFAFLLGDLSDLSVGCHVAGAVVAGGVF